MCMFVVVLDNVIIIIIIIAIIIHLFFWFLVYYIYTYILFQCFSATQLALEVQQERTQVMCSNK